ncbi:MAG: heme o synthase [Myxococcales bacterium]|nr:heme o synthase [Myxococcota bacterium]MDW8284130.1 heme o synthase [Myxococcales bacterium]
MLKSVGLSERDGAAIRLVDLVALTKPRVTAMVVLTAAAGAWLAPETMGRGRLLSLLVGTTLIVGGANALNMYLERDLDARMERTRRRPLPAGRLSPPVALGFGILLALLSLPALALGVNLLTALLGMLAFILYVAVYTPLKRHSSLALVIGAVPGAIPPLMGWTAATGRLGWPGVVLFAILFLWQLPHFLAITLYRAEEMARAGYKVTAVQRGRRAAQWRIVVSLAMLVPVSLLLVPLGVGGMVYLVLAATAGAGFLGWGLYGLRRNAGLRWARSLFMVSLVYLTLLSVALAVGRLQG